MLFSESTKAEFQNKSLKASPHKDGGTIAQGFSDDFKEKSAEILAYFDAKIGE